MEYCKGCLIKCTHYSTYSKELTSKMILGSCPCSMCLIKMVCIQGCDEFDKYIKMTICEIKELEKT
jgi:hypothetical protein